MKVLIVLSAVIAVALARPGFLHAPVGYAAPVAYAAPLAYAAPVSSQFHAQDSLGQYNYGYHGVLSSKAEAKSFDGVTRGGYSYVDAAGKLQTVEYTADDVNGFQVKASNLPVAPEVPKVEEVPAPAPVEDTPEVAKAKEEHFALVKEAEARNAAAPAEVVAPVAVSYAAPFHTYAAPAFGYAHHPYSYFPNHAYKYSAVAPFY